MRINVRSLYARSGYIERGESLYSIKGFPAQPIMAAIFFFERLKMIKQSAWLGHVCAAGANVIWGLMAPIAKVVMIGGLVTPLVLTDMRVFGAALLFWLASFFAPREKVAKPDLLRLFFASLFAIILNQGSYIFGVGLTTPGNATILTSSMPLWAMVLAAILLKDPITLKKLVGILMGAVGALILILSKSDMPANSLVESNVWGDLLVTAAQLSFAFYVVKFKDLVTRYNLFTTMKWMFTFASLCILPFSFSALAQTQWFDLSLSEWSSVFFVVIGGTFFSYLLIVVGQRNLKPTVAAMYNYVQPVVGCLAATAMGLDSITWFKVFAILLIFSGVYLVTHSRSAKEQAAIQEKQLEVLQERRHRSIK